MYLMKTVTDPESCKAHIRECIQGGLLDVLKCYSSRSNLEFHCALAFGLPTMTKLSEEFESHPVLDQFYLQRA